MRTTLAAFLLLASAAAQAAPVVISTGTTGSGNVGRLFDEQFFAGQFALDSQTTVTDVEGWIQATSTSVYSGTTVTVSVYTDLPESPAFTDPSLYTADFDVDWQDDGVGVSDWHGANNVSWSLGPGDYWLVFSVESGPGGFDGGMETGMVDSFDYGAVSNSYYWANGLSGWGYSANSSVGMRVIGTTSVVPVPAAVWLFGSALAGLGWLRRKQAAVIAD